MLHCLVQSCTGILDELIALHVKTRAAPGGAARFILYFQISTTSDDGLCHAQPPFELPQTLSYRTIFGDTQYLRYDWQAELLPKMCIVFESFNDHIENIHPDAKLDFRESNQFFTIIGIYPDAVL